MLIAKIWHTSRFTANAVKERPAIVNPAGDKRRGWPKNCMHDDMENQNHMRHLVVFETR